MWPFSKKKELPKGIFSYSSSGQQDGNQKSLLWITFTEAGAVIVVIGVILFVLHYLNILSLSKIMPQFFGNVSSRSLPSSNKTPSSTIVNNGLPEIQVVPDIKGYKLEIVNKNELMDILKNFGIYGKTYEDPAQGYTKGIPLNKIVIHLTDKFYVSNPSKDLDGKILASSGLRISPGTFDLYIWFSPNILKDLKSLNSQSLADIEILRALYRTTYIGLSQDQKKSREQYLIDYIRAHLDGNKRFFLISKV